MPRKWKAVKVQQKLVEEVEKEVKNGDYSSLSDFVSEAIDFRLQALTKEQSRHVEEQRLYTPKHIWIQPTPEGNIKIGVSEYWKNRHKGIIGIGNLKEGDSISQNIPFGTIETVAWWPWVIHDLISPIDGRIIRINEDVLGDPYVLNADPNQWILEIQPINPDNMESEKLLSHEEYKKLTTELEDPSHIPSDSFRWSIKQKARDYTYSKKLSTIHTK